MASGSVIITSACHVWHCYWYDSSNIEKEQTQYHSDNYIVMETLLDMGKKRADRLTQVNDPTIQGRVTAAGWHESCCQLRHDMTDAVPVAVLGDSRRPIVTLKQHTC